MTRHCPLCPNKSGNPVLGHGPKTARVMCIAEQPGKDEVKHGLPMVGKTGKEYDGQYLPLAGLHRREVYTTNVVKCMIAETGRAPGEKLVESCKEFHLAREIAEIEPEVIVLMGGVACRAFLSDLDLETHHGFPVTLDMGGYKPTVFPTFHPALGIHKGSAMTHLRDDFKDLKKLLEGTLDTPHDEFPQPLYKVLSEADFHIPILDVAAVDTEFDSKTGNPWCLTYSSMPATGYMIRSDSKMALTRFSNRLLGVSKVILHNAMADLPVLERMGVTIPQSKIEDTMFMSYHLGKYPQSLKRLAFRLCGMEMQDYSDLVRPYSVDQALDYLIRCSYETWERPEPEVVEQLDGTFKLYQAQSVGTKIKRLMTDMAKNPNIHPLDRWENWSEEERMMVEDRMGPMPRASISQVPFEKALTYSCRDADATLRVWHKLKQLKREIRRAV